jgi:L-ascorbate metabolism protein UlaG (beta-lactamase superfamily)
MLMGGSPISWQAARLSAVPVNRELEPRSVMPFHQSAMTLALVE